MTQPTTVTVHIMDKDYCIACPPEERSHLAPLILLPVMLQRSSVSAPFYLVGKEVEDARLNPTLIELLRRDFRIALPFTSDELPRDASGLDVEAILNGVGVAVHRADQGTCVIHIAELQRPAAMRAPVVDQIQRAPVRQQKVVAPIAADGGKVAADPGASYHRYTSRPLDPAGKQAKAIAEI